MKTEKLRRVLAPVNGGPGDERLLDALAKLCITGASKITLVYVVEVPQTLPVDAELPVEIDRGERVLSAAESLLRARLAGRDAIVLTELLQARTAGGAIVDCAIGQGAELVMMATENRVRHGKITFGDSVLHVLTHCPAEVIVIRLAAGVELERD